jgi:hypothetical protein
MFRRRDRNGRCRVVHAWHRLASVVARIRQPAVNPLPSDHRSPSWLPPARDRIVPDNTAAAACSMSAAATGAYSRFETTTLLTAQEAEAAMKKTNTTKTKYTPPHA